MCMTTAMSCGPWGTTMLEATGGSRTTTTLTGRLGTTFSLPTGATFSNHIKLNSKLPHRALFGALACNCQLDSIPDELHFMRTQAMKLVLGDGIITSWHSIPIPA